MLSTLIIGDLHLGRKHNVTYGDASIWDNKSLSILNRLINMHNPEQLVLAGDVFDSSKPTALVYSELIGVIARVPIVWIIAGNHDISKITEDIAFDNLGALENIFLVKYGEIDNSDDLNFIGWHATQELYDEAMKLVLAGAKKDSIIVTHCSRLDFGNEMDNICTDEHIRLAKAKNMAIVSGHEHSSSLSPYFMHLGSVVPHTIAELGPRYYLFNRELLTIPDDKDIILTREEPLEIDPDKVYYVKTGKEITMEDLKLEAKDLTVDILEDFWKEATKAGFTRKLLDD